ncbi:MAG: hypothetical protein WBP29_07120 [Candidatus Zixiibacteriota bacterium]
MKKLILIFSICTFAWLGLAGCGDDDCTVCPDDPPPAEKEYHFLYNFVGDFYHSAVLTYSTKTGEVVDSAYYGRFPFWDVKFTSDGKYACYTSNDVGWATTWITDYATGDTVSVLQGVAGTWLSVSHDNQFLLLSASAIESSRAMLFRIPSLEIVYESAQAGSWSRGAIHPWKNLAIVPNYNEDSLLVLDFESGEVEEHKVGIRLASGEPMTGVELVFSPDGLRLILDGGPLNGFGSYTQIRDATALELLYEFGNPISLGPYVHPDGERVFYFVPWRDMGLYPSSVWEFNLRTLLMRKILDGRDYIGGPPYVFGLNPSDMDITPDGKYAFLNSGGEGMEHGPILKLDLDTYQIVDAFYPPAGVARSLRMYPLEIKN